MKKIITICSIILISVPSFAQHFFSNKLEYGFRPKYKRAITKDILDEANSLDDIIADYPSNWIDEYTSVEVLVTREGKILKSLGTGVVLSAEQKSLLSGATLADDVEIKVNYKSKNPVTGVLQRCGMHTVFTLVPETEAEFVGGEDAMNAYLKSKGIEEISKKMPTEFKNIIIGFVVSETGNVENVNIVQSSGNQKVDNLLLEVVKTMPKWKSAKNKQGIPVKQEFQFSANSMAGGC